MRGVNSGKKIIGECEKQQYILKIHKTYYPKEKLISPK